MVEPPFTIGNAASPGPHRGWILGHFIDPADPLRHTDAAEIKWGQHPAGDARPVWTEGEKRTTLCLLVRGRFRLGLRDADGNETAVTLAAEGDYIIWGPGVEHTWRAETESTVITIRWPSLP